MDLRRPLSPILVRAFFLQACMREPRFEDVFVYKQLHDLRRSCPVLLFPLQTGTRV